MFLIFRNSNLRFFFFADIISQFGSGLSLFALSWHLMVTSGSNTSVATLVAVNLVASALFQPLGGVIADRYPRMAVLMRVNSIRAICMASAVAAYSIFHLDLFVFVLSAISGAGWSLFFPASRSFIQEIATDQERISGNSIFEVSLQTGFFSSVFVAGFLYKYLGFAAIIWLDVLTFVISNLFLGRVALKTKSALPSSQNVSVQLREGVGYLIGRKWLVVFGFSLFVPFIATMAFNVVTPGYVALVLRGDSVAFGILEVGYPMGACFAGLLTASLAQRVAIQHLTPLVFLLSLLSITSFILNERLSVALVLCFLFGYANSSIRILMYSSLMDVVPPAIFSRVISLLSTVATVLQIIIMLLIGRIMDAAGVMSGFAVLASIMLVGLCLYFIGRPNSRITPEKCHLANGHF